MLGNLGVVHKALIQKLTKAATSGVVVSRITMTNSSHHSTGRIIRKGEAMLINRNNSSNRGNNQSFMRQENRVGILTTGTAKVTNSTHIMVGTSVTS